MIKHIAFIGALLLCGNAQEVSVFGAGDLDSDKPYGLTSSEKYILKNKKQLGSIDNKVKTVKEQIDSINSRLDGIESVYESDSRKLNDAVRNVNNIIEDKTTRDQEITDIKDILNQLMQMQEESNKNIAALKSSLKQVTNLVNKINKEYVSAKEFELNMQQFANGKKTTSSKPAEKKSDSNIDSSKSNKELMAEAKAHYEKQYYKYAIPIFEALLEKNYKPAESNFYLGEIWYYRKKYDDAIKYFKQSAMLYDKASWMPTLLLHSAISFEKTGDIDNASNFYNTLINVYGNSEEAKIAKKKL